MVSADNLLCYLESNFPFMLHTVASDKQLCAIISYNNKPIVLF